MLNQKGSAAIMAIGVMIVLGLFAVAILPMVTNEVKFSKINSDAIEAQFAAEAGAKRAISAFNKQATDWSWLNSTQNLIKNVSNKTYVVTVNPVPVGSPSPGTYTVVSIGTVNGVSRKVAVEVTVSGGGKLNDGQGANSLIFDKAIFAGANLSLDQHANITGSIAANGTIFVDKHSTITGNKEENAGISPLPSYGSGGKFDPALYNKGAAFPWPSGGKYTLSQPLYYVSDNLTINKNTLLDVTTANGTTIIYVKGNVVIDQNVDIASGDNILLIAAGSVAISQNLNKNNSSYGNLVIVAQGNNNADKAVLIEQNTNITGGVYANGSIAIAQNADIAYSQEVINAFTLPGSGTGGVSVTWQ
ncbi:hypothetical protein TcarDRAFT_1382 [Thermosinus carboxydivorans Nor1]|uniref:DUF7305 domain-containing protein n=1 Tax=Thermosinus carboxydivorans Nor1 TaxID=401526 RepID=A1HRP4_9FIRM|nr:hypothetical protein [Thermosinus carboxydivorans]EAX47364.1 hypothetical protein TcarDRAFT_1382 [Thermosinus carboxydivorans Nor1]